MTYLHTPKSLATFLLTNFFHLSLVWHSLSAVRSGKPVSDFSWSHHRFQGLSFWRFPTRSSLYAIFRHDRAIRFLRIMSIIVFSTLRACFIHLFRLWSRRAIPSILPSSFIVYTINLLISSFKIVHVLLAYSHRDY